MSDLPKSRKAARGTDARFYFTGVPCKNGHVATRYVAGGTCTVCAIAGSAARFAKLSPAERHAEYLKYKDSRQSEAYQRRGAEWYRLNTKRHKRVCDDWRKRNPEKHAHYCAISRAARLARRPRWLSDEHKREIRVFYQEARRLTAETGEIYHVDHIVPLLGENVSGLHVPWNLQVIPYKENIVKSNRFDT